MRGKRTPTAIHKGIQRITPAYAGKTLRDRRTVASTADHPRVCGENYLEIDRPPAERGSPPRMRGKHKNAETKAELQRITPAYAGKTGRGGMYQATATDHPRVCGENLERKGFIVTKTGSPPRMRGKHTANLRKLPNARITPAYAGKTLNGRVNARRNKDHPRVCGENTVMCYCNTQPTGSPPQVRGKLTPPLYQRGIYTPSTFCIVHHPT